MTQAPSVADLVRAVSVQQMSAADWCAQVLSAIDDRNPALYAVRSVDREQAMARARDIDALVRRGQTHLPLAGAPVLVKDNVSVAKQPLAAGRKDGPVAERNATIVTRLLEAGAVIVGRANMDELAYGVTGTNPHTGQVRNPHRHDCHPGGSSAGSGAAVGASMVPLAIGTDTAGSVRIPASLCGIVGLRATLGRVPTDGVAPLAPSFDCVGPLARSVDDVALLFAVLAADPSVVETLELGIPADTRAAVLTGRFAYEVEPAVQERLLSTVEQLKQLGVTTSNLEVPELAMAPRASGPIIGAEASHAWAAELEAHPEWFGEEVAGHVRKATTLPAVRYLRAQDERRRVVTAVDAAFEQVQLLVLPTTPTPAYPVTDMGAQLRYLALTVPFSLSGHPAISVPMGEVGGLPVGVQLVARRGQEALLLRVAKALESRLK